MNIYNIKEVSNQVIPDEWIQKSIERWKLIDKDHLNGKVFIGIDSSFTHKENTICKIIDGTVIEIIQTDFASENEVIDWIISNIPQDDPYFSAINVIGGSRYIYEKLRNKEIHCTDINFASRYTIDDTSDGISYLNYRTYAWFEMRKAFDPISSNPIAIPDNEKLIEELKVVKWSVNKNRIRLQNTEEIYKTIKRSTSLSRSLLLATIASNFFNKDKK